MTRRLIVNADDFGQTAGITEGIIRSHEHGIVTSASLMVRWPTAEAAADYARRHPRLSVGLHIDLGEWMCVGDEWVSSYQVVNEDDAEAVRREIGDQVESFRRLMHREPTHLDSHQHVHHRPPARDIVLALGESLGIPVRSLDRQIRYAGAFYGQTRKGEPLRDQISAEHLVNLIDGLPEGTTELGCHPGLRGDAPGMYVNERDREVEALCDPRVRAALEARGVALISFSHAQRLDQLGDVL